MLSFIRSTGLRAFSTSALLRKPRALVSPSTVNSLLTRNENVKFLDVRSPEEYSKAHITDAVNCFPIFTYLATSDAQGVAKLKNTFEDIFQDAGICGDEHIITYENCLQTLYGASCRGLYLLKLLGHPKVSVLNGGLESWVQHGYPTSKAIPKVKRGTFRAVWTPSGWSNKEDVAKAIEGKDTLLLDVRDIDEWKGITSSPYGVDFAPRKGRLPDAVYISWKDFMESQEDGLTHLKDPEDVLKLCAAKGITLDQKIIVYCFKGARASNTYIALKEAGFKNVTNYFASWNEWSRDADLEIDSEIY